MACQELQEKRSPTRAIQPKLKPRSEATLIIPTHKSTPSSRHFPEPTEMNQGCDSYLTHKNAPNDFHFLEITSANRARIRRTQNAPPFRRNPKERGAFHVCQSFTS